MTSVVQGPDEIMELAARVHRDGIVIDHVTQFLETLFPTGVSQHRDGGVTVIGQTASVGAAGGAHETLTKIGLLLSRIRALPNELLLIESVDDIRQAKAEGKLGVMLHFQTCSPFERDLNLIEVFYRLGVRVALLAYNVGNYVAPGISESPGGGLTKFGRRVVQEMNRVGMVVDGSHTGERATFEAMELCNGPFIFSHSNCKAVYNHPRNITDEQIRACAQTGGVVGVVGLPYFTSASREPSIDDITRHVVHIAELVGTDHIGVGMDYWTGVVPYSTPEQEVARLEIQDAADDLWSPGDIPPHPWGFAPGLETPAGMRNLTAALLKNGFTYEEVRKIMGENFLRVYRQVWKPGGSA